MGGQAAKWGRLNGPCRSSVCVCVCVWVSECQCVSECECECVCVWWERVCECVCVSEWVSVWVSVSVSVCVCDERECVSVCVCEWVCVCVLFNWKVHVSNIDPPTGCQVGWFSGYPQSVQLVPATYCNWTTTASFHMLYLSPFSLPSTPRER